jgi:CRISPR-associated protein Cas1
VRHSNLILKRPDRPEVAMPLADVAVVVAAHPQITCTQPLLSGLASAGAVFVTCDEARLPVGMMLPLQGHFVQTERIARQIGAKRPLCKRLWQQVVRAKIYAQAAALKIETGADGGLQTLVPQVRSGDPTNVEARAARRYWLLLFGEDTFRRERNAPDVNRILNYGYAVLRAMTGRAICASGLHPSIGIHHHNRYSQFTLADDLMEPFRVIVDRAAVSIARTLGFDAPLDKIAKAELIAALTARYRIRGEEHSLFDILARLSSSLVQVFSSDRRELLMPRFETFFPDSNGAA